MPFHQIPPPQRSGYRRSDPSEHLRTAINASHLQSPELLLLKDSEIIKYCKSLHQSHGFEWTLTDHRKKLLKSSRTTRWTHQASVNWIDCDEHRQGVNVSIKSSCGTEPIITEGTYVRPPVEALEEHIMFDTGTRLSIEHYRDEWERAASTMIEAMSRHGIEEPFTGTSKIKGGVKFMNEERTSLRDTLSVQIDFTSDKRDPLRFHFTDGILTELDKPSPN